MSLMVVHKSRLQTQKVTVRYIYPGWLPSFKIAIRNVRRDANDSVKKLAKDKEISEDEAKRTEKEIQELTDKFVAKADEVVAAKEKEVMEI